MAILGGWGFTFPKTPTQFVERSLDAPVVSPVGLFGIGVKKIIIKQTARRLFPVLAAAGGGFLFARLFGGGGAQKQDQDITQQPTIDTTITPDQDTTTTTTTTTTTDTDTTAGADIEIIDATIYGDVGTTSQVSNVSNITKISTITHTFPTQITETYTTQITHAAQEQRAEQGTDFVTIALIAVAGLIGYQFLKGK